MQSTVISLSDCLSLTVAVFHYVTVTSKLRPRPNCKGFTIQEVQDVPQDYAWGPGQVSYIGKEVLELFRYFIVLRWCLVKIKRIHSLLSVQK